MPSYFVDLRSADGSRSSLTLRTDDRPPLPAALVDLDPIRQAVADDAPHAFQIGAQVGQTARSADTSGGQRRNETRLIARLFLWNVHVVA